MILLYCSWWYNKILINHLNLLWKSQQSKQTTTHHKGWIISELEVILQCSSTVCIMYKKSFTPHHVISYQIVDRYKVVNLYLLFFLFPHFPIFYFSILSCIIYHWVIRSNMLRTYNSHSLLESYLILISILFLSLF